MNNKPKIMELCLSDGVGGLELYMFRSVQQLLQRSYPCVAVVRRHTMLSSRMDESAVPYIGFGKAHKWLPWYRARQLARIVEQNNIDIIHVHWAKDLNVAVLARQLSHRPVKLVYTRQMMITRPKHDPYHRWLYRHVDRVLAITDELKRLMQQYLPIPKERIERLYYGVDAAPVMSSEQRREIRSEYGFRDDDFVVFMVGRIEECKGQHLLIEAVERLRQQGVEIKALLVGPAMDEEYLQGLKRDVANRELAGSVRFAGPHKAPSHIAAAFDVALLATECETFGLVLIEAMRAGVAVIGTRACGVLEIIDEESNGLLFPPGDSLSLAGQLERLYRDSALKTRLAEAGKTKADTCFATERHYEQLEQVFMRVFAENAG